MRSIVMFIFFSLFFSCKNKTEPSNRPDPEKYSISLGQWTYQQAISKGEMDNFGFIAKAAQLDLDGVEYLSRFLKDHQEDHNYLDSLSKKALSLGLTNVMLLVDEDKKLGAQDSVERIVAINLHKNWIDTASKLGCPAMRINVYGDGSEEAVFKNAKESVSELSEYARSKNIRILIENHGSYSSDPNWLKQLLEQLDDENIKCNLDVDNWCIQREDGELWGSPCIEYYPRYEAITILIDHAHGISVKSFDFDENGEETSIDYSKVAKILMDSGFTGYLGIEYEGNIADIDDSVKKTMALLKKHFMISED